jgi:hypothetical protein
MRVIFMPINVVLELDFTADVRNEPRPMFARGKWICYMQHATVVADPNPCAREGIEVAFVSHIVKVLRLMQCLYVPGHRYHPIQA